MLTATNGTGKSYFVKNLLKKEKKVLVVLESDRAEIWQDYEEIVNIENSKNFQYQGVKKILAIRHDKDWLLNIIKNFRNGVVVFDDAGHYVSPNIEHTKGLKSLLIDYRHLGTDFFFMFHSPSQCPPKIYSHAKFLFVGKTKAFLSKSSQLAKAEEIRAAQIEVNTAFDSSNGVGADGKKGIFKMIEL